MDSFPHMDTGKKASNSGSCLGGRPRQNLHQLLASTAYLHDFVTLASHFWVAASALGAHARPSTLGSRAAVRAGRPHAAVHAGRALPFTLGSRAAVGGGHAPPSTLAASRRSRWPRAAVRAGRKPLSALAASRRPRRAEHRCVRAGGLSAAVRAGAAPPFSVSPLLVVAFLSDAGSFFFFFDPLG